jgi:hypothetical protein
MVRPVRLGMVFEPSIETLRLAIEQATMLWAALYQPLFGPSDMERLKWDAPRLGVDVLWAFDQASVSVQTPELDGYKWRGRGEWSPLAPAKDFISTRLLGPEHLLDYAAQDDWTLPRWTADDPLRDMFSVWFGSYGLSDQGKNLERQFAARASEARIELGEVLPADMISWITPIEATGTAIEYAGLAPGAGFVVVDPTRAIDLIALWNMRVHGAKVFPWPIGHENRILPAAMRWLRKLLDNGELQRWMSGDGQPLGPHISVWLTTTSAKLPEALKDLLATAGVDSIIGPPEVAYGWRGNHPFVTDFSHGFSQPLEAGSRTVDIPVPKIGGINEPRGLVRGHVIAVQLEITGATDVRPDWTFSVPNVRALAPFLTDYDGVLLHFDRPTADGRVLAASSAAQTVSIPPSHV